MFGNNFGWANKAVSGTFSTQKKCVSVHKNGDYENSKVIYIEPEWGIRDLLNAASFRLDLHPVGEKVYNRNGVIIDDCLLIEDNDMLFISTGEKFIHPTTVAFKNSMKSDMPNIMGSYRVKKLLGRGGFGEVRVGQHIVTNELVALKFIRKMDISDIDALDRTNNEIQCLSTLHHKNIIAMIEHIESPEFIVLAFELMEGGDLHSFMKRRGKTYMEQRLSSRDARLVFSQLINAVSFAHSQCIIHRDLKLENVLLKGTGLDVVKVADFGLSAYYRPGSLQRVHCGTLTFLAPEAFNNDIAHAGPPLDVWSLGVILFTMLCGRLPFDDSQASTVHANNNNNDDNTTHDHGPGHGHGGRRRRGHSVIQSKIIKGQYRTENDLLPEEKDLIRMFLTVDPELRCTLPEALNHPWMKMALPDPDMEMLTNPSMIPASPGATASTAAVGEDSNHYPNNINNNNNADNNSTNNINNTTTITSLSYSSSNRSPTTGFDSAIVTPTSVHITAALSPSSVVGAGINVVAVPSIPEERTSELETERVTVSVNPSSRRHNHHHDSHGYHDDNSSGRATIGTTDTTSDKRRAFSVHGDDTFVGSDGGLSSTYSSSVLTNNSAKSNNADSNSNTNNNNHNNNNNNNNNSNNNSLSTNFINRSNSNSNSTEDCVINPSSSESIKSLGETKRSARDNILSNNSTDINDMNAHETRWSSVNNNNDVITPLPVLDHQDNNELKNLRSASSEPMLTHSTTFKLHRLRKSSTADSIVNQEFDHASVVDTADDDDDDDDDEGSVAFHDNLKKTIENLFPSNDANSLTTTSNSASTSIPAATASATLNAGRSPASSATPTRRESKNRRRPSSELHGADAHSNTPKRGGASPLAGTHGNHGHSNHHEATSHTVPHGRPSNPSSHAQTVMADSLRSEIDHSETKKPQPQSQPQSYSLMHPQSQSQSRSRSVSPALSLSINTPSTANTPAAMSTPVASSPLTTMAAAVVALSGGGSGGHGGSGTGTGTGIGSGVAGATNSNHYLSAASPLPVKPEYTRSGSSVRNSGIGIAIASAGMNIVSGSTTTAGAGVASAVDRDIPYPPPLHKAVSRSASGLGRSNSEPRGSTEDTAEVANLRSSRHSSKRNMVFS